MPLRVQVESRCTHGKRKGLSAEGGRGGGKWSFVAPLSLLPLLLPLLLLLGSPVVCVYVWIEVCG
jgi:hypothetical protein